MAGISPYSLITNSQLCFSFHLIFIGMLTDGHFSGYRLKWITLANLIIQTLCVSLGIVQKTRTVFWCTSSFPREAWRTIFSGVSITYLSLYYYLEYWWWSILEVCYMGSPKGDRVSLLWYLAGGPQPLSWALRMKVAVGAARGLSFLHDKGVIFRDFKASNILLNAVSLLISLYIFSYNIPLVCLYTFSVAHLEVSLFSFAGIWCKAIWFWLSKGGSNRG